VQEYFFLLEFHFVFISGLGGSIFSKKVKIFFLCPMYRKESRKDFMITRFFILSFLVLNSKFCHGTLTESITVSPLKWNPCILGWFSCFNALVVEKYILYTKYGHDENDKACFFQDIYLRLKKEVDVLFNEHKHTSNKKRMC